MPLSWRSKLIHPASSAPEGFRSLVPPVHRGSTTLFASAAEARDTWDHENQPYTYGLYGTPTTLELAARIAELEGGHHTFLTPGGQAAIALVDLAFAEAGSHVLVPESIYGPNRAIAERLLARLGMEIEIYDPLIGSGIASLIRDSTRLIWCESPGSVTMEVQDVPAIVAAARERQVVVALDNTYAAGVLLDAFALGVDVAIQALTKYVGGHSDLLLGSVTLAEPRHYERLGDAHQLLGMAVSPDDCALALRGLQTLGVRLKHLEASTMAVASWLDGREEIERVLHPAFPACPGHDAWKRDFTGSSSVFSIVFAPSVSRERILRFVDGLTLFKIGYSWGGATSLVMPFFDARRSVRSYGERLVRLNIGLEETTDLIRDLEQALRPAR